MTQHKYTHWVCDDCIIKFVNDESPAEATEHEPMHLLAGCDITPGLIASEHSCGEDLELGLCDGECERREFSKSWCAGCGTTLAGGRYAVTEWWTD